MSNNNLIDQFKEFLLSQANPVSYVTVKNYLSDVNRFINWFETKYQQPFDPQDITLTTIEAFKKDMISTDLEADFRGVSFRSLERYLSCLRKFFRFLKLDGQISHSPFEQPTASAEALAKADPWRVRDFKNSLYVLNASHLTIKNYIIDVKQFIIWAEHVLKDPNSWEISDEFIFNKIDSSLIEEYKQRLLKDMGLSPVSVNRKLSSLRKYLSWANQEELIKIDVSRVPQVSRGFGRGELAKFSKGRRMQRSESQENFVSDLSASQGSGPRAYSGLPPVRLLQKVNSGFVKIFDDLITYPLLNLKEKFDLVIWESRGRPVFTDLRKSKRYPRIYNIPKGFYNPTSISTKYFSIHRKVWHHLRHTRPNWYKKYRSYAIVSYFHFVILMLFISVLTYAIYSNLSPQKPQTPTLAALPTAPPRILSFQGRLTDANDNPITTQTSLRMAIYNNATASGSALLWQEIVSPTPDADGIFNVTLGKNTPIPQSLFAQNSALWLGVTVGRTPELTPRQQIATVAYAVNAETLQGLPPITSTTATSNVVLALNSSGNLTIGGVASPTFQATGGTFTLSGQTLVINTNVGSNGDVRISPDGTGGVDIQKALKNTTSNGSVIPGAVEVHDIFVVLATTSSQAAFNINQGGTNNLITASTSGVVKFFVGNSGAIYGGGNLEIDGSSNDIAGTLNLSGNNLTSGSNLTINATNGYVRIGDSATPTTASGDDDLFVESDLEVGGIASIAGSLNLYTTATIQSNKNQTITIGGNTSGNITLSPLNGATGGNITPGTNNQVDLGTTSLTFRNIYVNSVIGGSSGIQGWWQRNNNALSQTNITDDILLGSISTASSKFAFINVAGGTPTASISANSGNNAVYLSGDGTLSTTNSQTLTIGGSSTGNISITPNNGGAGSLLTLNSLLLTLSGTTTLTGSSLTTMTTGAAFTINGSSYVRIGDSASPSTATSDDALFVEGILETGGQATISGNLTLAAGARSIQSTANNTLTIGGDTSGNIILSPLNGTGSIGIGTTTPNTFKLEIAGSIGPTVGSSYDLGSSARRWATIYGDTGNFTNISGTVTGGSTSSSDWLINSANSTGDTQDSTLTFERGTPATNAQFKWNSTTKQISMNSSSFAILPETGIAYSGTSALIVNQIQSQDIFSASASGTTRFTISNGGAASMSGSLTMVGANSIQTTSNTTLTLGGDTSGNIAITPNNGSLGIVSVNSPTINGNATTLALFNTVATTINFGGAVGSGGINFAGGSGSTGCTIAGDTGNLVCSGDISGASTGTQGYWQRLSGAIAPTNISDDLLLGATSTASSKFAFLNVAGGTPTASISANSGNNATYLTGDGTLATTNRQTLTLGNSSTYNTTGNVLINPNGTGKVGIGTTSPLATLDIRPNTANGGTLSVASISGATSFAGLVIDNSGVGDIFTASSSGLNRFVVKQGGNVGIGTVDPDARLEINHATGDNLRLTYNDSDGSAANYTDFELGSDGSLTLTSTGTDVTLVSDFNTGVNIGASSNTPGVLSVSGGIANNAAFIVNNTNSGDLITASASGTTRFTISNAGAASMSGSLTMIGANSIQTTSATTLTLGGSTTGNIVLSPLNSASGARVQPGADNLVSLGASPSARFKDLFLGSGSVHIQCTTGDGCGQGLDYALGVNTSTGTFSIGVNGATAVGNPLVNIMQGGNVGIGTTSPNTNLTVNNANESTTLTNFTQALTNAGFNIMTEYTANAYTPGIFWSTSNDNATKPKAGIWLSETGSGTNMFLGTSNSYVTGVTNQALTINPSGFIGINDTTPTVWLTLGNNVATGALDNYSEYQIILYDTAVANTSYGLGIRGSTMVFNSDDHYNWDADGVTEMSLTDARLDVISNSGNGGYISSGNYGGTGSAAYFPSGLWSNGSNAWIYGTVTFNGALTGATTLNTGQGAYELYAMNQDVQTSSGVTFSSLTNTCCEEIRWSGSTPFIDFSNDGSIDFDGRIILNSNDEIEIAGVNMQFTGSGTHRFWGNLTIDGTCTSQGSDCAVDFAEFYPASEPIEKGELVIADPDNKETVKKSTAPYENGIIGITSTDPGFLLSDKGARTGKNQEYNPLKPNVALSGRVPLKVSTESGQIKIGDPLTSSSTPGVAMKATRAGQVVGKAMENYSGEEIGSIITFVNVSWYDPDVQLADSGYLTLVPTVNNDFEVKRTGEIFTRIGGFSEVVSAKIQAGLIEAQQSSVFSLKSSVASIGELSTNSLAIATDNISIAGQNIRDFIVGIVDERISQTQISLISPIKIEHNKVVAKLPSPDSTFEVQNSSGSAVISLDSNGDATFSGKISANQLSIRENLDASEASISGTLRASQVIADDIVLSEEALVKLGTSLNISNNNISASPTSNEPPATSSADTLASNPNASSSANGQLSMVNGQLSSGSAVFEQLTVTQGLMSFGPTSFFEASVADRLFIGSQLSLADNSINVLGSNLEIQSLKQGGIRFLSGLVEIDNEGNLKVEGNAYFAKDVEIKGRLSANIIAPIPGKDIVFELAGQEASDSSQFRNSKFEIRNSSQSGVLAIDSQGNVTASGSGTFGKLNLNFVPEALALSPTEVLATGSAGTAFVKARNYEVTVLNEQVSQNSLIYITPIGENVGKVYLLRQTPEDKNLPGTQGSFTVGIDFPVVENVKFNFLIIN